jgi:hypothetical protein
VAHGALLREVGLRVSLGKGAGAKEQEAEQRGRDSHDVNGNNNQGRTEEGRTEEQKPRLGSEAEFPGFGKLTPDEVGTVAEIALGTGDIAANLGLEVLGGWEFHFIA